MTIALKIENLHKRYASGHEALKGISLTVEQGDFIALLGPNGAGKSTTIGIICSLVNKSSGQVEIFGVDIDTDFPKAKTFVGVVPQEFNFNQFEKVFDILVTQAGYYGIPRKLAKQRAEKYLKQLGLWEKRDAASRELSGGMKRRLMIARALVHEPKLLILDEPTAGVDIELRRSMWSFLKDLNKSGITIILTTHYLEEAENLCRTIAIIDQGRIVEHTSMKELLAQLQTETYVLDLAEPQSNYAEIEDFKLHWVDNHTLEAVVDKAQTLNQLFDRLDERGIKVRSFKNKANRLEELFVNLVEKNLKTA